MKKAFIAERDRQYKVTLDIEKLENRYQYLLSDTLLVLEGFSERITSQLPMMTATSDVAKKRQMISKTSLMLS